MAPTPEEQANFAKRFTKDEWWALCHYEEFLETVQKNLKAARPMAERLLKKWKTK
jgi:hypothetical protein